MKSGSQNNFRGCLLGGAVGDVLGAPVEFMTRQAIIDSHGPRGIENYVSAYGRVGAITDDTQMTLFTAEGLIRGLVRERHKGITTYPGVTANAYLRWLHTQGSNNSYGLDPFLDEPGWLYSKAALHNCRAPGSTCLSALRNMDSLGERAVNNSKGCGGVMRVAPVGLFVQDVGQAFSLGCELAAITHGHPTGFLAAGVLAAVIAGLREGDSLDDAIQSAKNLLVREQDYEETLTTLDLAQKLAADGTEPVDAIAQLGGGWIAEEALAISVYCALIAKNFREAIVMAVNHSGDSDSTGAITGNLLGVIGGEDIIPAEWLEPLELRGVIVELANDLHDCGGWDIGMGAEDQDFDDYIWKKYPGF